MYGNHIASLSRLFGLAHTATYMVRYVELFYLVVVR